MTTQFSLNLMPEKHIWRVSELTLRLCDILETEFPDVWVEGEISNFRAAQSGHLYFTLKDEKAQIYVSNIEPVGLGALQLAFEKLTKKLQAEGLFDADRKKALPVLPRRIGIVSSPQGAAIRDVIHVLRRRFPNLRVLLFPVKVQGDGAAEEIVRAIRYFNRAQLVDVLIVARGGGSLEDLWAFNEEIVARAIAASEIPIITGVGHETDTTIADFAADVRAPTPSAAAEIVVRTRAEFEKHIVDSAREMVQHMRYFLSERRHVLRDLAAHRAFRRPEEILRRRGQHLDELNQMLD